MPPDNQRTLICLSHLAWDPQLFQRPQQLMQRFAGLGYRVIYIGCVGARRAMQLPSHGVTDGVQWHHVSYAPGSKVLAPIRQRLARGVARQFLCDTHNIIWLYHPTLLHVADGLHRKLLVYDVMDRFDAFDKSHGGVAADEKLVLEMADVVFTGGHSLQSHIEQKMGALGDVRAKPVCFPSGLDLEHFSAAAGETLQIPADLATASRPILGYFGAIDERIDFELIAKLGAAAPHATIALIGPQLTRPTTVLPNNVKLLGPRPYAELPAYLKAFDVCLLPFRETALVAHISPTKTPEYLAGGKPVVSTMIPDVATTYGDVVPVASGDAFVVACIRAAQKPPDAQSLKQAARRARTWDDIAQQMHAELQRHMQ